MKTFLLILSSLWLNILHAEDELEIKAENCQINHSTYLPSTMELLKDNNQPIVLSYRNSDSKVLVKGLEMGHYQLNYETFFKTKESKTLEIKSDKKHTLKLCMDYLDLNKITKKKTIIEQLKLGEYYVITITTWRISGKSVMHLAISRKPDAYFLSVTDNNITLINQAQLTRNQIVALKQFETELKHLNTGIWCDHHSLLTFTYNGKAQEFSNGCMWSGKTVLLKKLGIN